MNKELQDLAWAVLPKETKEEVKRVANIYNRHTPWMIGSERALKKRFLNEFIKLFGHDNLASDAEGEEMLIVSRKRVQEIYSYNEEILSQDPAHSGAILLKKKLTDLFGSKCLPDETRDKREKREIKRELNEDNFAKSDEPSTGGKEVNFTSKAQPGTNCNGYDDRRLHIAAQILAGLYTNELYARNRYMDELVRTALKATDMLIAKSGKGGSDGE